MKEPSLKHVNMAANRAISAGHGRTAQIAMIAAGWIPTSNGWMRCKPEWPGDRQFVIDMCNKAVDGTMKDVSHDQGSNSRNSRGANGDR